ncbi:MAG: MFS transporter [Candidatus Odinarchaeota archaeon]
MNHIGNYITPALLIFMQVDIQLTQTERGILGSIPMVMMVFMSTIIGWLGDRNPLLKKPLIWIGLFGIGAFCAIISFAHTFTELALATIILGLALSAYHPLAFTYINTIPNRDRNMGINAVCGNAGNALTPFIAMIVAVISGWRASFLFFGLIQFITGLGFVIFFPNDQQIADTFEKKNTSVDARDKRFTGTEAKVLVLLLVLISAARGPVFRCLSFFTSIVFNDEFGFDKVASSIITAVVLGVGALASYLAGSYNNRKITKNNSSKNDRVRFRVNMMLLSTGLTSIMLLVLVVAPVQPLFIMFVYLATAFAFFLGAAILPSIIAEIASKMSSSFGLMFTGATLTGAIAPTVFGFLADAAGFSASFIFLDGVAVICMLLLVVFKISFKKMYDRPDQI